MLIGLHKHIGFLLQEEATLALTSAAVLPRADYDRVVRSYLRAHDPYSPDAEIQQEWRAITVDAGERLVLIVESPADIFGFELRSIQEFFAACYLLDTAKDTELRYRRFSEIILMPHWRNVALFFAGRVSRNNPGEAANIVEVCRQADRLGADRFIKRGAQAALELAADRALAPNRVLQRSLLEHGLGIFGTRLSHEARRSAIEWVQKLPDEDIRDHVIPVFEERLRMAGQVATENICAVLCAVAPDSELLRSCLLSHIASVGRASAEDTLELVTGSDVPNKLRIEAVSRMLDVGIDPQTIGRGLADGGWATITSISDALSTSDIDARVIEEFASQAVKSVAYLSRPFALDGPRPTVDGPLTTLLRTAGNVGRIMATRSFARTIFSEAKRILELRERIASELPEEVLRGDFDVHLPSLGSAWMMWLAHLSLGEVTAESWGRFIDWRQTYAFDDQARDMWNYCATFIGPFASVLSRELSTAQLNDLRTMAIELGGFAGFSEWLNRVDSLARILRGYPIAERIGLTYFGPGFIEDEGCGSSGVMHCEEL